MTFKNYAEYIFVLLTSCIWKCIIRSSTRSLNLLFQNKCPL